MFGGLGFSEMVLVGIIAVLLFGKRLPEVAKSLGQTYQKFRKGLVDFQSSIDISSDIDRPLSRSSASRGRSYRDYDDYDEPAAPKFEPPPSEPRVASSEAASAGEQS